MAADEWTDGAFASRKSKRYTGNWADFTRQFGLSRAVLLKNTPLLVFVPHIRQQYGNI